jgi:hypothetical protein
MMLIDGVDRTRCALTLRQPGTSVTPLADWLERRSLSLFGVVACVQFSIAAESLLALMTICWLSLPIVRHERVERPVLSILVVHRAGAHLRGVFPLPP